MPDGVEGPPITEKERNYVMHAELPILNGFVLMATDMISAMGSLRTGNNVSINLEVDTIEEADRLYAALSQGDDRGSGMTQQFFGYWGSCEDRFGVRWIVHRGHLSGDHTASQDWRMVPTRRTSAAEGKDFYGPLQRMRATRSALT